jgi:hypothetical protein
MMHAFVIRREAALIRFRIQCLLAHDMVFACRVDVGDALLDGIEIDARAVSEHLYMLSEASLRLAGVDDLDESHIRVCLPVKHLDFGGYIEVAIDFFGVFLIHFGVVLVNLISVR